MAIYPGSPERFVQANIDLLFGQRFRPPLAFWLSLWDGRPILPRVRRAVVDARPEIPHHRLAAAHGAGEGTAHLELMAFGSELGAHLGGNARFDFHIAARESVLG